MHLHTNTYNLIGFILKGVVIAVKCFSHRHLPWASLWDLWEKNRNRLRRVDIQIDHCRSFPAEYNSALHLFSLQSLNSERFFESQSTQESRSTNRPLQVFSSRIQFGSTSMSSMFSVLGLPREMRRRSIFHNGFQLPMLLALCSCHQCYSHPQSFAHSRS